MTDNDRSFIEMHRTFRELSKAAGESDDVDLKSAYYTGSKIGWSSVLTNYRVVLLSEAGSGKTEEIRNVARRSRAEGKSAFFLRLEHVTSDFEEAFEEGTFEEFKAWLASEDEGWVLLDSVDEARLRSPSDFELAIKKIGRQISAAQQRTHVVITGRTTAWRPKTDLALCANHLPYSAPRAEAVDIESAEGGAEGAVVVRENIKSERQPIFKVMALEDLTPKQVEIFASASGVIDTKALHDAIERVDAFSFTARPQDLAEIIDFWQDHQRIGSRLELMRNSIERRLTERDQTRALANPMNLEKAQKGARIVAGATTLTQRQTIRVPDGAEYIDGLPIQSILEGWDEKDCSTLLSRPIFDEAIYGSVRFHHRSVREFLAASWLTKLLGRETSRRAIEEMFFRDQYGLEVVVPSARSLLPWMIISDQKIRDRALRLAPELVFEGGDPSQLPLDLRRQLLRDICARVANQQANRSGMDFAAQRFASAELADDVSELLTTYASNSDVCWLLLRMVWQGLMVGVLPASKAIALNPKASNYTRIAAMRAVEALGSEDDLGDIRTSFLFERRELNRAWLAELVTSAKPNPTTVTWLLAALGKAKAKEQFSTDGLSTAVFSFVERTDLADIPMLVEGLENLLSRRPHTERRECEISIRYRWLVKIAAFGVERIVAARDSAALCPASLGILRKVWMTEDRGDFSLRDITLNLPTLIPAWRELHDALFWFEVAATRKSLDRKKGERLTEWWRISFNISFWVWKEEDFAQILEFVANRPFLDDRLIALSIAFNLYRAGGR